MKGALGFDPDIVPLSIPTDATLRRISTGQRIGYIVTVTPDMARAWLASNTDNRKPRASHIAAMAAAIRAGQWRWTHQAIAFSDARLIDGQHRLKAVIEADTAAEMMVMIGMDDRSFVGAIDRGKARSNRDDVKADPRAVEAASFLVRLVRVDGVNAVRPDQIETYLSALDGAVDHLLSVAGSSSRGRTSAALRGAVALRWWSLGKSDRQHVDRQWAAWVNLHVADMAPSIGALLRRIENRGGAGGSTEQTYRAARAWIAFDPSKSHLSRIQVTDIGAVLSEMRDVMKSALAAAGGV
jgi:hypothetical protein